MAVYIKSPSFELSEDALKIPKIKVESLDIENYNYDLKLKTEESNDDENSEDPLTIDPNQISYDSLVPINKVEITHEEVSAPSTSRSIKTTSPNVVILNKDEPSGDDESSEHESSSDTSSKKRKRQPDLWKQNIRKRLRESGQEYVNIKGTKIPMRKIGPPCKKGCVYLCSVKFSDRNRLRIHEQFWNLKDLEKDGFYGSFVKQIPCKSRRHSTKSRGDTFKKRATLNYFLEKDGETYQVCKIFFLNTLSISEQRIYYFFNKKHGDENWTPVVSRRGLNTKRVTDTVKVEEVKTHIHSFPRVESHCFYSSSKQEYLENHLTVTKMYELYKEKILDNPVSIHIYRKVFNDCFNLSFHVPKKDQCDKCVFFRSQKSPSLDMKSIFVQHTLDDNCIKFELDKDRNNLDEKTAVIFYDLQSVFSLPKGFASNFYNKRKLRVFNLTGTAIIPKKQKVTYCSIWNEKMNSCNGNDVASALKKILETFSLENPEIENVILWSDLCVPKNRNQVISTAILCFLSSQDKIKKVVQKFGNPNHFQIEEISLVHNAIEKYLKGMEIPSPLSLVKLLSKMNHVSIVLKVLQMHSNDFHLYFTKSKDFNFSQVPYSICKVLYYGKSNIYQMKYKLSFGDVNFYSVIINKSSQSTSDTLFSEKLIILKPKPLSPDKVQDLIKMLPYMPDIDRGFYEGLI